MNSRLFSKSIAFTYTILIICILVFLSVPMKTWAAEYDNTSVMEPVEGTPDLLITGEDGTLRYRVENDHEIENAWVRVEDKLYYFDNTGRALTDTLRVFDGNSYYFDKNGVCVNGLTVIDGDLYFFTPGLGMNIGWVSAEGDEDIYYFDEDGKAHKGLLTLESEDGSEPQTFYFDDDGRMHRGWLETDKGKMYFNEDGVRLLRWNEIDGEWYYFKEYDDGYADIGTWLDRDGKRVYLSDDGTMLRNTEMTISGMDYRFDDDGGSHPDWISGITGNSPYLLAFLFSTVLIYLSSISRNKYVQSALGLGAVVVVAVLAALRSINVGTDISMYIMRPFEWAAANEGVGFFGFMRHYILMEPFFNILTYISVYIVHSPHFVMGALSFITSAFIYAGICNKYGHESRWFAWLAYCLIFYNMTMNIMRQYAAVAILYYLFSDKKKLNWKRVILLTILAMSIHFVGAVILGFWVVYEILESALIPKAVKYLTAVLVALIPPVGPRLIGGIIEYLVEHYNEVFWKYTYFIYGHESNNGYAPDIPQLFMVLVGGAVIALGVWLLRIKYARYESGSEEPARKHRNSSGRSREPSGKNATSAGEFAEPAVEYGDRAGELDGFAMEYLEAPADSYGEAADSYPRKDRRYRVIRRRRKITLKAQILTLPLATAWLTDLGYCICSNIFNGRFQFCVSIFRLDFLTLPQKYMGKKMRWIFQAVLVCILLYYWLYMYVYLNNGRTSPYEFWFEY